VILLICIIMVHSFSTVTVLPSITDPTITDFNSANYAYFPDGTDAPLIPLLFFFLPGTDSSPVSYNSFLSYIAHLGYAVASIDYNNLETINTYCEKTDPQGTCFLDVRNEILTGQDSSTKISVTPASSILNRFLKLLMWLDINYPTQGWNNYFNETSINWNNIVVSGHSQGSGHAALIGIRYTTSRIVQFGGCTDYYTTGVAPTWTLAPPQTPKERFFGFRSKYEFVCLGAAANWVNLGMPTYGAVIDVTDTTKSPPYFNSHQLCTSNLPNVPAKSPIGLGLVAHIAYIADGYLPKGDTLVEYQSAWTYLALNVPCEVQCPNGSYCAMNGSCISLSTVFTEPSDPCLCDEGSLINGDYIAWVVVVIVVGISALIGVPIILICRFRPSACKSCYKSCPRCCTFWGDCGKKNKSYEFGKADQ